MERALTIQGFLCIALAVGLALAQWLAADAGFDLAAQAPDRAERWSATAEDSTASRAPDERPLGANGTCPG
jgi:hypothetical protein